MMKNKKLVSGILALVILISGIVGYIYWEKQKQEPETGIEWFQTGNTLSITQLETKLSEELEDNRMGGVWDLKPANNLSWCLECYGNDADEFVHGINELGSKRVRLVMGHGDWPDVDWSKGEYSKYYICPNHNKTIIGLAEKDIKIMCGLVFWDSESPGQVEEEGYLRFKTEDEIQRYLDYVKFIVNHFKDRIEYYEILNEPNIGHGTQQYVELDDYINLVKRVVPVIREEHPGAKIVVGATAAFREENTREYLFGILKSDIMPLVDGISFHPMYGETSPQYDGEYYYNYSSLMQEIKDMASAHGFKGEFIADEINYRTQRNPNIYEPWTYSEIVAAKYYARGIIINLGLDLTVGLGEMEPGNYNLPKMRLVKNMATVMAGAEPVELPIEIQSEATNIRSYTLSLSNGDKLISLWTDGVAVDEDPGVNANLTVQGITSEDVTGIDVLEGYQQPIVASNENGNLVIENLIVRDYPLILRITKSS